MLNYSNYLNKPLKEETIGDVQDPVRSFILLYESS